MLTQKPLLSFFFVFLNHLCFCCHSQTFLLSLFFRFASMFRLLPLCNRCVIWNTFVMIIGKRLQPSLSLDNAVEVFLLKNEGEFVSVEQGQKLGSGASMGDKKKKREENMRQLLDVTNTITSEEMRDFEMRYAISIGKTT